MIYLLRIALGVIFIWYGTLKMFYGLSPAQELATKTIDILFFTLIPSEISIKLLGVWEIIIGGGFLLGIYIRGVSVLFLVHIILTFAPLFVLSDICFTQIPYAFTLEGQYIGKNIIFILVGLLIYEHENNKGK